jgi:hypothetical protein
MKNHRNIIGPNDSPTAFVPNFCMKNNNVMIMSAMGTTGILGLMFIRPSTAETIVIEGVITPSARRKQPPMMAKTNAHLALLRIRANKENMPPSPLLSALSVMMIYLIVVWSVSVQKMQDSPPRIKFALIESAPATMAFITYKGEVPISPYTIPNVISNPAAVTVEIWLF